jgi:hypothetical protein
VLPQSRSHLYLVAAAFWANQPSSQLDEFKRDALHHQERNLTSSGAIHPGNQARRSFAPTPTALVFVVLAIVVPILLQHPLLNSDGDLARHLAHGRYMLEHGRVIRADPFSFTRPGAPFVAFEYGSQLIYALAERVGGLPAVAVLAGILIALTYSLLTRFLLTRGVDPLLACLTVAMSIVLGIGHWSARPHLVSFLAVVLLLDGLEGGWTRAVLPTALLFIAWANLHGGFVYGWFLIGTYLLGSAGEFAWGKERDAWRSRAKFYSKMLGSALAATLLNPHGLGLHRHLLEFFGTPYLMENTAEFVSPNFHEAGAKVFLGLLLGSVIALSLYRPRPTLPRLLLICTTTAFALISVRNIPLFGLTALPILALHLDSLWRRLPDPRGLRASFEITAATTRTLPWVVPVAALLVLLAAARGRVGSLQLIRNEFAPDVFPVAAVTAARSHRLEGQLFSEFAWGGYVLYAWPEQRIFIDGGTDFFGEDVFRQYVQIKQMSPGWRDVLDQYRISLMLLERDRPFTYELARGGGWLLWYCDSLAVVLRRSRTVTTGVAATADSAEHILRACATHPVTPAPPRQPMILPRGAKYDGGSLPPLRAAAPDPH